MEISMFDPWFGINFKVEEPVELDDLVIRSSQELVSKDVNVVPEKCIEDECDSDKAPVVGNLVTDRGVVFIRTNQNPIRQNSAKAIKLSHDLRNKDLSIETTRHLHIKTVHEGINYPCGQCDRKFACKSNLTQHIQVFHNRKNYPCYQCGKQFASRCSLNMPVKVTHKRLKFTCNVCNKEFAFKGNLNRHHRSIHEGMKYTCNHCDRKFTTNSDLNEHVKVIHEGIVYRCDQCNKRFSSKSNLKEHLKRVHPGEEFSSV
ncbi:unnamed protein product [Schistosoma haematobium]|nr:unnamed protein product [Schistosoma haematobium]CAH8627782.1 unnamed protein product [Schistosoma haematobium]